MTSSGIYGDIRCRRRRRLYNFFRPSDSLWSGDLSYQNSAPFHVLNSSYRVRVTLTPPVFSMSKKPSGGRVNLLNLIDPTSSLQYLNFSFSIDSFSLCGRSFSTFSLLVIIKIAFHKQMLIFQISN